MLPTGLQTTTALVESLDIDMELVIREAQVTDIADMVFIEEECFSTPWSRKSFAESLSHTPWHFFVAVYNGKIVGYGGVYLILDEGQISNIATLPAFRGKGIGRAVLEEIIKLCRAEGCEKITLELRESNSVARALYESCGFTQVGKRPNFYSNPQETAILMDKSL